jgi:protein phosphatase 1 regulatory subunit 21
MSHVDVFLSLLQEGIKHKDQAIRKYEQEIDSLSFRNQQLSKRVIILQEELDETQARGKKNKVCYA